MNNKNSGMNNSSDPGVEEARKLNQESAMKSGNTGMTSGIGMGAGAYGVSSDPGIEEAKKLNKESAMKKGNTGMS